MKNIALVFVLLATYAHGQTKKIIFVCEHGAAKSVIATSYFNKLAKERNLNWEATCRGTNPDMEIGPTTKEGLTADNLFDPKLTPQKLLLSDTNNVERIILFTPLPQNFETKIMIEDWSATPNIDANYELRRDAIIKKITLLLDSLENK